MIDCIDTRFFKRRRNANTYIEEQNAYGYYCQLVPAYQGFIVNVFMEVA